MVGQVRSFKGATAFDGSGFRVDFQRPDPGPFEVLSKDAVAVRGASIEAVHSTTEEVKEAIRDFIDAHFTGSEFHGNGRRRVSNASAQSTYYDEIDEKGQYAGLVYSKFGTRDAGGFVDFLMLHVRGGTLKPRRMQWLRIRTPGSSALLGGQSGFFALSRSDIFFKQSADGKKLFQFRRFRKDSPSSKRGKLELLATLVKQVKFPARLSGIDLIAARRPELFEKHFFAALEGHERAGAAA